MNSLDAENPKREITFDFTVLTGKSDTPAEIIPFNARPIVTLRFDESNGIRARIIGQDTANGIATITFEPIDGGKDEND